MPTGERRSQPTRSVGRAAEAWRSAGSVRAICKLQLWTFCSPARAGHRAGPPLEPPSARATLQPSLPAQTPQKQMQAPSSSYQFMGEVGGLPEEGRAVPCAAGTQAQPARLASALQLISGICEFCADRSPVHNRAEHAFRAR